MTGNMRLTGQLILVLLLAAGVYAQQGSGTISGTVTDQQGALVPAANIEIRNAGTNAVFRTATNASGFYTAPGLPVGEYQIAAEAQGFKRVLRSGVVLRVDQKATVDIVLQLGAVVEQVEVVGTAALVDAASATVGKVVENRRIQELPLNGRNALALTLLTPAVRSNAVASSGFGDRGVSLSSMSINNGPNSWNNLILDGGSDIQTHIGEVNINPAVDAVEEFKVQTATMSAEFGYTAGGVINIVTKSGTNRLHGTAYEFLRNDLVDARNTFAATKGAFRYNQFGASAGGPIVRDKFFFFANWEEWRYRKEVPKIGSFPTLLQRLGDFSDLKDTSGRLIPIYDPATTARNPAGSGYVRSRFPNNLVPADRLDKVALNIQKFYPEPNRTPSNLFTNTNNYGRNAKETRSSRQATLKVDYHFSEKNILFGRYARWRHSTDGGAPDTGVGGIYPDPVVSMRDDILSDQNMLLSDTHTFSPRFINEFRLAVVRSSFPFQVRSYGGNWPSKLGFPPSVPNTTFPAISNGLPGFTTGTVGFRGTLAWQFFDMATKIHGSHTLKFGIEHRINRANNFQAANPSGSYSFSTGLTNDPLAPAGTGSAYASFLLGEVASATVSTHAGESWQGYATALFINDDWKVARRLTLNLGLRYDFQKQPVERHNGMFNFDPLSNDPISGLLGRTVYAGVDGQPRTWRKEDKNDFGPRFGFAYALDGSNSTVLRGGYAIFYPSAFNAAFFGNTSAFANTSTSYTSVGGSNFRAFRLSDGLPSPPIPCQGASLGPSAFLGQAIGYDDPADGTTPLSMQWNLSLQRQLRKQWLIDLTYSANRGYHFVSGVYDTNQMDPKYYSLGLALQDAVANPYAGKVPGSLGAATITRSQLLRPFPYYQTINVRYPRLVNYTSHLFLLTAERRTARGFTMLFSYTAGKLITNGIGYTQLDFAAESLAAPGYQNGKYDRSQERTTDPRDISQRFVVSTLYDLPFGKGNRWHLANAGANRIVSGWQLNTIGTMQTGKPLGITGANNYRANRPNSTGQSAKLEHPTAAKWFDTAQFVNPPNWTVGNVGRVLPDVREPGTVNWDFSLIKNTSLTERVNLQFRAESFNFLNHVNLGTPATTFSPGPTGLNQSGSFGVITSAKDARIIQFALKLMF